MATYPITLILTTEFLADVLITALEGGVGYWLQVGTAGTDPDGVYTMTGFFDAETGDPFCPEEFLPGFSTPTGPVSVELIARGCQRLFTPGVLPHRDDLRAGVLAQDAGQLDASDADVIFQLGFFGRVVFG